MLFPEQSTVIDIIKKFTVLWNLKVHYRNYKSLHFDIALGNFSPVPKLAVRLSKIILKLSYMFIYSSVF